jgi:cell division protein FtsQ
VQLKKTIQRILFILFWTGIGTGMILLLGAAIGRRNQERFRDYTIEIKGQYGGSFLNEDSIERLLRQHTEGVKGELLSVLKLRKVEEGLKQHPWIRGAQLYFDNKDILHVGITEKTPVARLFTQAGQSLYLDELGLPIPLAMHRTVKVPVFTGLPVSTGSKIKDSLFYLRIRDMTQQIVLDSFWSAQAAQFDRLPDGTWEMIPVIGNHVVRLQEGEDFQQQLKKLMLFYQQVLVKAGFDRYRVIDLRFNNQVVASYGAGTRVDSIRLRRSVEQLLAQSRAAELDTMIRYLPKPLQPLLADDTIAITTEMKNSLPLDSAALPQKSNKKINN